MLEGPVRFVVVGGYMGKVGPRVCTTLDPLHCLLTQSGTNVSDPIELYNGQQLLATLCCARWYRGIFFLKNA